MKNIINKLLQFIWKAIEGKMIVKANLLLIRKSFTEKSTLGELYLNGEFKAHTLELPWKDNQRSISCIPSGTYDVRFRYPRESASRDYLHLMVKDVKDRDYILFHRGNTSKDTRGCILTGLTKKKDWIGQSTLAHEELMNSIIELKTTSKIKLIIKNK
ncbi:MAG: hypothetical protein Unbinned2716contig1000_50 [Prokaryotic dsDNA virus sp.]|nr:MAG: hypothetical protein Unbinned2716contig1000_50 [Prokaryotic dsDNA virus sp.]|tara:strand:+ start:4653 stop:5126 length:474 start_codon:yes stop_codon:yes gene_type:complete